MEWTCKFCNIIFEFEKKHQQKGGHLTNCLQNPKRKDIINSISETNTLPRIEIIKDCENHLIFRYIYNAAFA